MPGYAAVDQPPSIRTWKGAAWQVPGCVPWPHSRFGLVVALAGRFRHRGDSAALIARFGAISAMRGLRYWSVSEGDWRVLITEAYAADGAGRRRSDFRARELSAGAQLEFVERDNRSGLVTYRMRVLQVAPDRVTLVTENLTPVRAFGFTLFPPGALRAAYFVQRLDGDTWGFYGLSTTGEDASALASLSEASYVNRATALYSYFTAGR